MNHTTQNKRTLAPRTSHLATVPLHGNAGFTLIEMIVSIFIFSIVMVIATGSLVSILGANRKAQAVKAVMNNLNFSLDSMTRAIRVGTEYDCGVSSCSVDGSTEFSFIDTDGDEVIYRLNDITQRIERSVEGGSFLPLTAPDVTIERLRFYADGESDSDDEQPRVLIIVGGVAGNEKARTNFDLQTLVSQRILDR
ncbi:MAG: type II secretion system protein [Candidatus Pacebacteria bacterium]|nr:type II secretion system protein [Candidatus Paceibacterota bacterium]